MVVFFLLYSFIHRARIVRGGGAAAGFNAAA
jgi:hypothetical protein